ncbi:hypothetical protein IJ596_08950 [bacterium]|nr:hypothetical protein [bacterium]
MFPQLTPEERKVWYIDAVRGSLVINHGVTGKTADVAIKKYQLQDRLNRFPEIQMHYDTDDVADEIVKLGYLANS